MKSFERVGWHEYADFKEELPPVVRGSHRSDRFPSDASCGMAPVQFASYAQYKLSNDLIVQFPTKMNDHI